MVPNAQRVHRFPEDYWRPLPGALRFLFRGFAGCKLYVYGNLVTTLASLHGVAAEELDSEELLRADPDYPVASCIVAWRAPA